MARIRRRRYADQPAGQVPRLACSRGFWRAARRRLGGRRCLPTGLRRPAVQGIWAVRHGSVGCATLWPTPCTLPRSLGTKPRHCHSIPIYDAFCPFFLPYKCYIYNSCSRSIDGRYRHFLLISDDCFALIRLRPPQRQRRVIGVKLGRLAQLQLGSSACDAFDRCIVALPIFVATRVVRNPPAVLQTATQQIRYAPWLVANIHIDKPLLDRPGAAPSWDNVLYGAAGLGYVDAKHQSLQPVPSATVLTY